MSLLQRGHSLLNAGQFAARNRLWRGGERAYCEPAEDKHDLFRDRQTPDSWLRQEQAYCARYDLHAFRATCTRQRYLETLTHLEFLEQLMGTQPLPSAGGRPLQWLDVGAKNWSYVQALDAFAASRTPNYQLTGIELDPGRRYADFRCRADYARAFMASLPRTRYRAGDVMAHHARYDVITVLLPFVFADPLLAWGLPLRHFDPLAMLAHAVSLLNDDGVLLILNQGKAESVRQGELFEVLPNRTGIALDIQDVGRLPESFLQYHYPRYGWRCRKPPQRLYSQPKTPEKSGKCRLPSKTPVWR